MTAVIFFGLSRRERARVYVGEGYRYMPLWALARPGNSEIIYSWGNLSAPSAVLAVDLLTVALPTAPDDDTVDAFLTQVVALLHSPFCLTRVMILDWHERYTARTDRPARY